MDVISREKRSGKCKLCNNVVYDMLFVKTETKDYFYTCLDCLNRGNSVNNRKAYSVELLDESRLAREEVVAILVDLAEEDETIFRDARLDVVKTFKNEILEGTISTKLEKYIKFHGNDIRDVLNIRSYALEALHHSGKHFEDLVSLYKQSRIRKLVKADREALDLLLCRRDIQELNPDNLKVYENFETIRAELSLSTNQKRYDNFEDIAQLVHLYDKNNYLTEQQLSRLRAFYFEMVRRNKML